MGAGQSLELLVPLPNRLTTHATVELQLFYTLQELHHLLSELILLLPAAVDALREAVYLQRTQLWGKKTQNKKLATVLKTNHQKEAFVCVLRTSWKQMCNKGNLDIGYSDIRVVIGFSVFWCVCSKLC